MISYFRELYLRSKYYILNRFWYQSHMIDTKLKRGSYYDKDGLMEHGLLELVDDFVSKDCEDAFSVIDWEWDDCFIDARSKIIKVLYFKHIEKPSLESSINDLLNEMYNINFINGASINDLFDKMCDVNFINNGVEHNEEYKLKDEQLKLLEKELYNKTQEILHLIIDLRTILWT